MIVTAASDSTTPVAKSGIVNTGSINLRSGPSVETKVVTVLPRGTNVTVLEQRGDWLLVRMADQREGWIYRRYVTVSSFLATSREHFTFQTIDELTAFAKRFLGTRYVWGGSSPAGFDCSGFTMFVFSQFGFKLPHCAADQMGLGMPVERALLRAGDLLFFSTRGGSYINHVGLYLGDGLMIHASTSSHAIRMDNINAAYYAAKYRGARRLMEIEAVPSPTPGASNG